jgi:hypothetical protein
VKDEQLQQRIKYLMEHGGIWDDPLADIRRGVRWAVGIAALALLIELASLVG